MDSAKLRKLFTSAANGASWECPKELRGTRGRDGAGFLTYVKRNGVLADCLTSDDALSSAYSEWIRFRAEVAEGRAANKVEDIERAWSALLRACATLTKHGVSVRAIVRYIGENMGKR